MRGPSSAVYTDASGDFRRHIARAQLPVSSRIFVCGCVRNSCQLLEARGNLQRMLAQIPLTDDERAAVEDGTAAVERLLDRLADTPTPAGPTPRELVAGSFIPVERLVPSTGSKRFVGHT